MKLAKDIVNYLKGADIRTICNDQRLFYNTNVANTAARERMMLDIDDLEAISLKFGRYFPAAVELSSIVLIGIFASLLPILVLIPGESIGRYFNSRFNRFRKKLEDMREQVVLDNARQEILAEARADFYEGSSGIGSEDGYDGWLSPEDKFNPN